MNESDYILVKPLWLHWHRGCLTW